MTDNTFKKVPMPEQDPNQRIQNFFEVALGYTPEMAKKEALRCLDCKHKPCIAGCPVQVDIPAFIEQVAAGNFDEAYTIIKKTNCLPAICGRVCPQEAQCEKLCVRAIKGEPVAIGRLERFVADYCLQHQAPPYVQPSDDAAKVAVIGAGPAGLTCAGDLSRLGYRVTIFEAFHEPGGVLVYGIPEFRLPKELVKKEIDQLIQMGVEIRTNMVIGKVLSIDELFADGYKAVFIGSGAGLPSFLNIPGESLIGVFSANEYLTRANLMRAYDNRYDTPIRQSRAVAVIGGGNVAMDAARTALRLGAKNVYIVYRRDIEQMPARKEEVDHAKEEGIIFKLLCAPKKILGNDAGEVRAIACVEMELGEPDASGRARPVEKSNSHFILDVDTVIVAVGTSPNPLIRSTTKDLVVNDRGCIQTDASMATSRPGVFAGGDTVTGAATVILAMGAGKIAAASIHDYIQRGASKLERNATKEKGNV